MRKLINHSSEQHPRLRSYETVAGPAAGITSVRDGGVIHWPFLRRIAAA